MWCLAAGGGGALRRKLKTIVAVRNDREGERKETVREKENTEQLDNRKA